MERSRAVRLLSKGNVKLAELNRSRYVRQKLVEPSLSQLYHKYIRLQNETDVRTVDPSFELIVVKQRGIARLHSNESNY